MMLKLVISGLMFSILSVNCDIRRFQNDSLTVPSDDRSIGVIAGIISNEIRAVSSVLNSIANKLDSNGELLGSMADPLKQMLDLLSPKLVTDYIGEMYAVSDDCADTEIRLMVLHKQEILDQSITVFRQTFNAFRSYVTQTDILARQSRLIWSSPSSSIESSLGVVLSTVTSSLVDFLSTASKILASMVGNMETLVDLPEQTFLGASNFGSRTAFRYMNLISYVGDTMKNLIDQLGSSGLGRTIASQLDSIKSFVNADIRQIQRGLLGLLESNRNLQTLISQLMQQLTTATGADAIAIQQQIDDAEDQVSKNMYVIETLRNLIQSYTSIANNLR